MPYRMLPTLLLCAALCLSACGGGGGGGDDDDELDPLAALEGDWKGSCALAGDVIDMTVGADGLLVEVRAGGLVEDASGTFVHLTGRLYGITLLFGSGQEIEWRLLLDESGTYAAFAELFSAQTIALEKDATTTPTRTLSDFAPGEYAGEAARFDASANLLVLGDCDLSLNAQAFYTGQFEALSFFSPPSSPAPPLPFATGSVLRGPYDDDDASTTTGLFSAISTPDGGAIAIFAFEPGAGRRVFYGLLRTL